MRKEIAEEVKSFFGNPNAVDITRDDVKAIKLRQLKQAPNSQGRDFLVAHHLGIELSRTEAVKAFCCECSGYYTDKRCDCEVISCVLYNWMPYGAKRKRYHRPETKPYKGADQGTLGIND